MPQPTNTSTASTGVDYNPLTSALHGFTVNLQLEYTADGCKIVTATPISSVDIFTPGWEIVSKSDTLLPKYEKPNEDCPSNVMDCQPCKCDVAMAYKTPGIPTPWGSLGSVTLTTVQMTVQLTVCASGGTKRVVWIDGKKQTTPASSSTSHSSDTAK